MSVTEIRNLADRIRTEVRKAIVGQDATVDLLLVALFSSGHVLLEGAPDNAKPDAIVDHLLQSVPDLADVSHIHVWSITSGRTLATLHVRPTEDGKARAVTQAVERELKTTFSIEHPTIAVTWNAGGSSDCS